MGELGLVLMGRSILSKSSIHFSVDGQSCVPSMLFDLRPNYGGGKGKNGNLLPHSVPLTLQQAIHGHSRAGLGQSPVGSLLLSPGFWCIQGFVCALQESVSPVLYKFCGSAVGLVAGLMPTHTFFCSAICKASSDNHFVFLHFFFFGMVLFTAFNVVNICP